jgi:hypothetical protein
MSQTAQLSVDLAQQFKKLSEFLLEVMSVKASGIVGDFI